MTENPTQVLSYYLSTLISSQIQLPDTVTYHNIYSILVFITMIIVGF